MKCFVCTRDGLHSVSDYSCNTLWLRQEQSSHLRDPAVSCRWKHWISYGKRAAPCHSALLHQATCKDVCVRISHVVTTCSVHLQRNWVFLVPFTTPSSYPHLQATSLLRSCSVSSCVIAISCSILILANKQEQFSHSFKQALSHSSAHPAQSPKAGQIHQATCAGKPHAHQRLKVFLVKVL